MPPKLLRALSGLVMGAAAWCSCGVVAVTTERALVGLLPPYWALGVFIAAGTAISLSVATLPTVLMVLPAVAVLPWLSLLSPMLLLWTGPITIVLWVFVALAAVERLTLPSRVVVAAVVAALVIGAVGIVPNRHVTGDEPHYLLIARSLQRDGDFDLANDYDVSRHADFYPGALDPRHTVLAPSGHEYSFHAVGPGVLALPGLAIGGVTGARVLFALISVFGVVALWLTVRRLTGTPAAAWAGTLFLLLQLPFGAHATAIYPDGVAAAIVAVALLTLARLETGAAVSTTWLYVAAGALALLPWLHLRLAWIAVALGIGSMIALWRRSTRAQDALSSVEGPALSQVEGPALSDVEGRQQRIASAIVVLSPLTISAALVLATTYVMFETVDPTAAFRQKAAGSLSNVPAGLFGLLADVEYGLLPYAPASFFAIAGYRRLQASAPITAVSGAVATLGTLFLAASFVWWGGTSSPARFLVPTLPFLALCLGNWWPTASRFARATCSALIAVGGVLAAAAAYADGGLYLTNDPDGRLSVFEWMNKAVRVADALPSAFRPDTSWIVQFATAALWLIAGAVVFWTLHRRWQRTTSRLITPWPAAAWGVVIWITAATSGAWLIGRVDPLRPDRSQIAVLHASASWWWRTPWSRGRPAASVDDVLRALAIESPGEEPETAALYVPFAPAGRYRLELTAGPDRLKEGALALLIGRADIPLFVWPERTSADAPEFTTIMPVESLRVVAAHPLPNDTAVRLRPLAARATSRTLRSLIASQVVRHGDVFVYLLDSTVSIESGGFWVVGDRVTGIVCALADGRTPTRRLRLEAHTERVRVTITHGPWTQTVSLEPRQIAPVEVPASETPELIAIQIDGGSRNRPAVFVTAS